MEHPQDGVQAPDSRPLIENHNGSIRGQYGNNIHPGINFMNFKEDPRIKYGHNRSFLKAGSLMPNNNANWDHVRSDQQAAEDYRKLKEFSRRLTS